MSMAWHHARTGTQEGREGGPPRKLDEHGNLYVAANTQERIWGYSPEGGC